MFARVGFFILVLVLRVTIIVFHVIIYFAILYMNYLRFGDFAFSAGFVREYTDVSYVAGEGVELTLPKESVVVEELKAVEIMRSRLAQNLFMTEIIIELD